MDKILDPVKYDDFIADKIRDYKANLKAGGPNYNNMKIDQLRKLAVKRTKTPNVLKGFIKKDLVKWLICTD